MKERKTFLKIFSVVAFLSIVGCVSGITYAWFNSFDNVPFSDTINGDANGAYYASGYGTKDEPYEINKPIHLYNLAWLQYLGTYNTDTDEDGKFDDYYFKITADLDMTGYVLPPIGTTTYPFVGNFVGNDKTVSNLTVSNTFSDYGTRHPSAVTGFDDTNKQPEIIGFFGVVGLLPSTYQTYACTGAEASSVSNLYLEDIKIQNGSSNGTLAGFLAGYVNGPVTNCGVHYANFDFVSGTQNISALSSSISSYSYVGAINSNNYAIDGDSSGGDDAGTDYGTSTNIKKLYDSLLNSGNTSLYKDGTGIVPSNYALPFRYSNSTLVGNKKDNTITIYSTTTKTFKKDDGYYTYEAASNNIGYYVGKLEVYHLKDKYNFAEKDFGLSGRNGYIAINPNLKEPTKEILSYLTDTRTASDGTTYRNGDYLIQLNAGYSSSADYITSYSDFTYIENGMVESYEGGILLPQKMVWVRPKSNGTFKFVFVNPADDTTSNPVGIQFWMLSRTETDNFGSGFKTNVNYSSINSLGTYYCKYGYFEVDVKENTEYGIAFWSGSSYQAPYIAYMDIGASSPSNPDTTAKTKLTIDFVWAESDSSSVISLIKITDTAYVKSEVFLAIETSSSTTAKRSYFYYKRVAPTSADQTNAFTSFVYYYQDAGGMNITDNGTTTGHASEKDSINAVKDA